MPYELVNTFVDSVKAEALGKKVLASVKPGEQFVKIVYDKLVEFMGGKDQVLSSFSDSFGCYGYGFAGFG